MPHTLSSEPQGYGQVQTVITREHGIKALGLLQDQTVNVWTENGWEQGRVVNLGMNGVSPTRFHMARPSGLTGLKGKDDQKWARRGKREVLLFATEFMPAKLTEGRVINPMLYNRTLPCSAPVPELFTDAFNQGVEKAREALTSRDENAGMILGEPTSPDFVFGIVTELTRHRARSNDPMRRVLYHQRRDIIDWLAQNAVLGGYIMTTQMPPKIILDPANPTIGWKHSGTSGMKTPMDIYVVEGVPSGMMTLGNGMYVLSTSVEEY